MDDEKDSQSNEYIGHYKDDREREITEVSLTNTHPEHRPHLVNAAEPTKIQTVKLVDNLREKVTEKTTPNKSERLCDLEKMVNCFGYFIVAIGIMITMSSTYVNIWNTIRYVRFTSPCIINATTS